MKIIYINSRKKKEIMRRIKLFVLVVFVLSLFQLSLYSLITSRVEGVVIDKDTGQPIEGAKVYLFELDIFDNNSAEYESFDMLETNKKGYFKFNNVKKGTYFLSIFKQGYAAFGPLYAHGYDALELIGEPTWQQKNGSEIERFYLKEGQIKHFKINLEKEAILKIKVLKKLPNGIEPYSEKYEGYVRLSLKHRGFINEIKAETGSEFQSIFFKKGLVDIKIKPEGYKTKTYKDVLLDSGETKTIEYVADFTAGQVLHGVIKYADTKEPIYLASIAFVKIDEPGKDFEVMNLWTDENGEFWIGGFEPGTFKLYIHGGGVNTRKKFNFDIYIKIKPNEKKEIYKEF